MSWTRVFIPRTVEVICKQTFARHSSLNEVTFEEGSQLKRIEANGFARTSMECLRIPASVEILCDCCLQGCHRLSRLTFEKGSQLKRIGEWAVAILNYSYMNGPCHVTNHPQANWSYKSNTDSNRSQNISSQMTTM
jgi:hypothetical protein